MATEKVQDQNQNNESSNPNDTIEVLCQKMGDRWFAFSLIDDEVFVGSISQSEIESGSTAKLERSTMKVHRKTGNT